MANIIISDLQSAELESAELEYEELSDLELEAVIGGKRHTEKIDIDGDGKWDIKIVVRD
jgi:bacteriocin-like protein